MLVQVAVTECHRPASFNNRICFSQFWRLEVNVGAVAAVVLGEDAVSDFHEALAVYVVERGH